MYKKIAISTLLTAVILAPSIQAKRNPGVAQVGPTTDFSSATAIHQSDFDNGTFTITTPGRYYLAEDINFNPAIDAPDVPPFHLGWPTVLAIAADNVTVDLNGKTIQIAQAFLDKQHFGSIIQLNNQPFPQHVGGFTDPLVTPKNILIMNGTIGRSRHHGVHGNNVSNLRLHNLVIRDWETSAISINAPKSVDIRNVMISGSEHAVPITGLGALLRDLRKALLKLENGGDVVAGNYRAEVDTMIANGVGNNPSGIPDTNMWGILLNEQFSVGEFSQDDTHGTVDTVTIENVTISNLKTATHQTVAFESLATGKVLKDPTGFTLRWHDAFDQNGNFQPNKIIEAQVYLTSVLAPDTLPAGFANFMLGGTTMPHLLTTMVKPHFGLDFRGHTNKGIVGLRLEVGRGVTVNNCKIVNVQNIAPVVDTIATIPYGDKYPGFVEERAISCDAYGISMSACSGCLLDNVSVVDCVSENGNCHGIMLRNNSVSNKLRNCTVKNNSARGATVGSVVNTPSEMNAFNVTNGCHSNHFHGCLAESNSSPFTARGFNFDYSHLSHLENCETINITTYAPVSDEAAKTAVGFRLYGCHSSMLERCVARGTNCDVANTEVASCEQSSSLSVGILLQGSAEHADSGSLVCHCTSRNNLGGSGKAVGILLNNSEHATIFNNSVECNRSTDTAVVKFVDPFIESLRKHISELSTLNLDIITEKDIQLRTVTHYGQGFGIQDTAAHCLASILKNFAFANSTANYEVNYTTPNTSLPMLTGTPASINGSASTQTLNNINIIGYN